MKKLFFLIPFIAGLAAAIDGPSGYNLYDSLQNPYAPGLIICMASSVLFLLIILSRNRPSMDSIKAVPKWHWLTGAVALALYYISLTYSSGLLGISVMLVILIASSVGFALLIDSFGWFGMAKRKISSLEYVGASMSVLGAIMVVYAC